MLKTCVFVVAHFRTPKTVCTGNGNEAYKVMMEISYSPRKKTAGNMTHVSKI